MKDIITSGEIDAMRDEDGYENFLAGIRREFEKNVHDGGEPLFTTDADGLYELFLLNLPEEARQHYNCNACRHFLDRFGGLVRIEGATGVQHPVMWAGRAPAFFSNAVKAIKERVKAAKVTGVLVSFDRTLGTPTTGSWEHMAVELPKVMIYKSRLHTAGQAAAEKAEDHRLLCEAIRKYQIDTAETAVKLLRSNSMSGGEKIVGMAEWFLEVLRQVKGKRKTGNILWHRSATAPSGFCHISSSMVGTLLDDIEAGYDFDAISRKFAEKMNPLQYQRPQAAPSSGNVAQAERIVEKLGIENSLRRRFARVEELERLWAPRSAADGKRGGVFSGVETKSGAVRRVYGVDAPATTMTFEKFKRAVLPEAQKIEFLVTGAKENFSAIITAEDMSAPPILWWDNEDRRIPFSWYVYTDGSYPGKWCLGSGWAEVTGVVLQPNMWREGFDYKGVSVFFILSGAKDSRYKDSGNALFPEMLKADLREIRSTIEAYSKKSVLGGYDEASACGLRLQGSAT